MSPLIPRGDQSAESSTIDRERTAEEEDASFTNFHDSPFSLSISDPLGPKCMLANVSSNPAPSKFQRQLAQKHNLLIQNSLFPYLSSCTCAVFIITSKYPLPIMNQTGLLVQSQNGTGSNLSGSGVSEEVTWVQFLIAFVLSVIPLATIVGNVMVVYAINTEKSLQQVQNNLLVSLATADIFVAIFVMPIAIALEITGLSQNTTKPRLSSHGFPSMRIDFPSKGNPLSLKSITNVFKIDFKSILMDSHCKKIDSHRPPCHSHGFLSMENRFPSMGKSMENRWRSMESQPGNLPIPC